MANLRTLEKDGWFVDIVKLKDYLGDDYDENISADKLKAQLLDLDIRVFGSAALNDHLDKKKGVLSGPLVLQLTNWRNVSRPKVPDHVENDGVCKLTLHDGFSSVSGVQISPPFAINGNTPFGTKVLLIGEITYECGHLLLDSKNCKLLGGNVEKLIERWKISKLSMRIGNKMEKGANYTKFQPFNQAKSNKTLTTLMANMNLNSSSATSTKKSEGKQHYNSHKNAQNEPLYNNEEKNRGGHTDYKQNGHHNRRKDQNTSNEQGRRFNHNRNQVVERNAAGINDSRIQQSRQNRFKTQPNNFSTHSTQGSHKIHFENRNTIVQEPRVPPSSRHLDNNQRLHHYGIPSQNFQAVNNYCSSGFYGNPSAVAHIPEQLPFARQHVNTEYFGTWNNRAPPPPQFPPLNVPPPQIYNSPPPTGGAAGGSSGRRVFYSRKKT